MKYFSAVLSVSLVLFVALPLGAQQYGIEWADTLDNGSWDCAYGIAVDDSGNVYVTGGSQIGSNYDYLTVKYDSLGNIVWADTLDNGGDDYGRGIAVDSSENVYVTGWSYIGANDDYFTVKYDADGNILWEDTLDNGSNDYAYGIAVDNSGNIYVTGESYNDSNNDYFTVKYDASGNIVWTRTIDNGSNDRAFGIAVDSSGNIYVTGASYNGLNYDYLTVKYDSSGNILWTDTLVHLGDDYARGIAVDNSGDVYVTGFSYILGSNFDYFTVKYDASGNIVWADTIDNGNNYDYAWGITVDNSGNIYVTGDSYIGSNDDYLTVKYDASGNIVWADTVDNGGDDEAYGIAVDNNGNVYVTGYSNIGSNDDYFTVKYVKFKDAGILSIVSPADTVSIDSTYIPGIWVKNNSYELVLNLDISAFIDSGGASIYGDTQTVSNLPAGDSVLVNFTQWTAPSTPVDLNLSFSILTPDMNPENDTLSDSLYVRDLAPPVIDSAVAYDGTNSVSGIDDDDYVILYFSEATNKPAIDNTNIDNVLSLSWGHLWLDGFGAVGDCSWNTEGTQLLINLTTNVSLPTIAVGDTINPDGSTIKDISGNPCSSPAILGGSFDPAGITRNKIIKETFLNVSTINRGNISFLYSMGKSGRYNIYLYTIDGRVIRKIEGKGSGYYRKKISNLPSGVYFIRLKQEDKVINKKVVVIR